MADVKWIKIVTDIFDDEKILFIEQLPEADSIIVIWFKLLALSGKINNGGVLLFNEKMPYTDEMLATIFRRPINTIRLAIKTFQDFEMVEVINNTITIPNWSKHQSLDQMEERKNYMKNYMRDYREKQKLLAVGDCKANSKVNSKANSKANVNSLEEDIDIEVDKEVDKDKDKEKKEVVYAPHDEKLNQAILDFIDYRKATKAKMTDRAIDLMINKLNKYSNNADEQIEILNQSIMNGWKGIFPLDSKKDKNNNNDFLKEWVNEREGIRNDSFSDTNSIF